MRFGLFLTIFLSSLSRLIYHIKYWSNHLPISQRISFQALVQSVLVTFIAAHNPVKSVCRKWVAQLFVVEYKSLNCQLCQKYDKRRTSSIILLLLRTGCYYHRFCTLIPNKIWKSDVQYEKHENKKNKLLLIIHLFNEIVICFISLY